MAARFWVNGLSTANWSDILNWSTTSGGVGGSAVPLATDDVTFDNLGNVPCTVNTSNRVCKTLTVASGYTNTITFTFNVSVSGSINLANAAYTLTGAGLLRMITTGTLTTNGKPITVTLEIGGTTLFTCTLADAPTMTFGLNLTNTTSTTFSGAFPITTSVCTISGSQTVTIANDVTVNGLLTIADANVLNGAFNWNVQGLTATGDITSGTSTIVLTAGTWSGAGQVGCPLKFNGAVTVSGTVHIGASGVAVTWVSGAITTTGSTLSIDSACTLDTNGMSWNNITITGAFTVTINSLLTATGTLTMPNAAVTFAGTAGWTVGTFTNTTITATRIWTFTTLLTYTITGAFTLVSAAAQTVRFTFASSSGTTRPLLTLQPNATQDVGFADPTRIDSSGGQPIFSYHGVITDSPNWTVTAPLVSRMPQYVRVV